MTMEKHVVGQLKSTGSKTVNENCYVTQSPSTFLESLPYYYGCISREDAEWILYDENCPDGMYLLRESGNDLVLSLCDHNTVLHYRINKLSNGDVVLQGLPNQTFSSPMELIETVDGLACKPTRPLKAPYGKCLPPIHWCLSEEAIREQLIVRAPDWGLTVEQLRENLDCDLHFSASFSPIVRSLIVKSLHEIQPWYHFRLSRTDAERRIESSGHLDGKFLVRERDESSYAICLSHESRVKHYRIDILPSGNFAIQDGPKFDSIIALVSHYTIFSGGLWCMLGEGCPRPQEIVRQYAEQSSAQISNHLGPNSKHSHQHNHSQHSHCQQQQQQQQFAHPHDGSSLLNGTISRKEMSLFQNAHQRSRSIDRFHGEKCRICVQNNNHQFHPHHTGSNSINAGSNGSNGTSPHLHHLHHPRMRRVSTPTNLKLKEWFTTINHKWARIKRQVILHHQRQQPLINEDNYGTREEFSCCHVSSATLKHSAGHKTKTLSDLLNSARNNVQLAGSHPHYRCNLVDLQYSGTGGGGGGNRYTNGFGSTYGYGVRRQQFGRWHEEPIFSSRYEFDCAIQDSQENQKSKQQQQMQKLHSQQSNSVTGTPNNCKGARFTNNRISVATNQNKLSNGEFNGNLQNKNNNSDNNNASNNNCNGNSNELHFPHRTALIKSSSIDTIAGICNDPLEEVRRLHLREHDDIDADNDEELHFQSLNLNPLFGCSNKNNALLKRTNSFDGTSTTVNGGDEHCNCNCSDWLLDFDLHHDANDPFGSLPDDDDFDFNSLHNNSTQAVLDPALVNGKCCDLVTDANNNSNNLLLNPSQPITMQDELATIFTPSMCSAIVNNSNNNNHNLNNSATISTLSSTPFSNDNNINNNNLLSSVSITVNNNVDNNTNNTDLESMMKTETANNITGANSNNGSFAGFNSGSMLLNGATNTTINGCCPTLPASSAILQLTQHQQQQFKQFAANLNGRMTTGRKGFPSGASVATSITAETSIIGKMNSDNLKSHSTAQHHHHHHQCLMLNCSSGNNSPCNHHSHNHSNHQSPHPMMLGTLLSHSHSNGHNQHHQNQYRHYNTKSFLSGTSSCSSGGSSGSHSSSLTSTGSSGGGGGGCVTGTGIGLNRSFSTASTVSPLHANTIQTNGSQINGGHLSAHSTSMSFNSNGGGVNNNENLMDLSKFTKNDENENPSNDNNNSESNDSAATNKNNQKHETVAENIDTNLKDHQMSSNIGINNLDTKESALGNTSSTSSTVSGTKSISASIVPVTTSTNTVTSTKPAVPVIIDLLKEFDVCFTSTDVIDDDSSTLTDNSSPHSFNSPLKRKCVNNVFVNGTISAAAASMPGQDSTFNGVKLSMLPPNGLNLNSINVSGAAAGVVGGGATSVCSGSSSLLASSSSLQQSCNSSGGNSSSSSTFQSVSSIPAPTMPPPPPPNVFSLSSSSSSPSMSPCPSPTPPPQPPVASSVSTLLKASSSSSSQYPLATSSTSSSNNGTTNGTPSKSLATTSLPLSQNPQLASSSLVSQSNQHHQQQVPLGFDDNIRAITNQQQQRVNDSNGTIANENLDKVKNIELICLNEEPEEVQETIKRYRRGPICFDPRCISLKRRIGNGYFGDVFLATIPSTSNTTSINLAVKMLKSHAVPQQKAEILREAQTMAKLDHRHIVRLIGVCEGDPFMLVMELAPLGPLNKYLQNYGSNLCDEDILRLMLQVSSAMQYLEEMSYVHRDLAARNILLVNEKFAKVSDFGMSRALGQGKDYYKARSASKWPLKWYAPECIYYYKFSSRSDVWSYGVSLWEAMSRGEMPYLGMDGQDILRMFTENRRLPKPENCPVIIYQLMWSCWQFKPDDRVNFASITEQLGHYLTAK